MLLVSVPCLAQERADVKRAAIVVKHPDGPEPAPFVVEGGCWVSESACVAQGRELVDLRAQVAELKANAEPPWMMWVLAALVPVVFVGGYFAGRLEK